MALEQQFPRLATPADIPRLVSGERIHHQWPPPGTVVLPIAGPERWCVVNGSPTAGSDGDWWVTDLATIAVGIGDDPLQILARIGAVFTGPIAQLVQSAGAWPVIYEQGSGDVMRWIATTIRGTLGGVEQFQFGLNWGNPGADPDPNEAGALAFATTLRDNLQSVLATAYGGITPLTLIPADVKFTEVGATVKTQTSGTAADGSGGNLEQKFDTQWAPYTVGSLPTGSSSGVTLPYEVSMALTLLTNKRGPSGRGRIYFPPLSVGTMQAGGKFTAATCTTFGAMLGDLFEQTTAETGNVPVVVSRRRIVLNEVVGVEVGTVPDSQRRRRRSQDEARLSAWTL